MFICALGLVGEEKLQAVMLGGGLVMCGKLTSSSTSTETPALGIIQTLSFSTVFIDYHQDWLNRNK